MTFRSNIRSFDGEYRWLSNFWPSRTCPPTVEHQYQAAKFEDSEKVVEVLRAKTPGIAKSMGKSMNGRVGNWREIQDEVMLTLVRMKFEEEELRLKLLMTEGLMITEGNRWHDNYWGECGCARCQMGANLPKNKLGQILMQVRAELLKEEKE